MKLLLLRIFLAVAILAGLGAIYAGVKLKGVKTELQANLEQQKGATTKATELGAAEKKAKEEALAKLTAQGQRLSEVEAAAEKTRSELVTVQAKVSEAEGKLSRVTADLAQKQGELDNYAKSLPEGMTIDQVKGKMKEFQTQLATLEQEKSVLNEQLVKLNADKKKLDEQAQRRKDGKMPEGLTGHVLSVNPEWNFVVLDIGANQGVVDNALMIVYRDGKLVGKIKITSIEPSISIADILPEWQQSPIQGGDTVTF